MAGLAGRKGFLHAALLVDVHCSSAGARISDRRPGCLSQPCHPLDRPVTLGFDPVGTTPESFADRQKADLVYWKRMIDDTGIKVE